MSDEGKWLGIEAKKVTDAGLLHIGGLTDLRYLRLVDTKVTDEGVRNFQSALPNCIVHRSDNWWEPP